MRGVWQQVWRRVEPARICLLLVSVFCYYLAVKSYISMENTDSVSIYLSAPYPDNIQVEEILEESKEAEDFFDICFYWDGGISSVENESYGRSSKVLVAGLTGDASLYDWRGNALSGENRKGCMIDRKTALELFGSTDCVGGIVTLGKEQYEICRVIPWKYKVMLIHPTGREIQYSRVFIRERDEESLQNTASHFLMSYGLNGVLVDDGWLLLFAKGGLFLLPAGFIVTFFKFANERKKATGSRKKEWIWQCAIVLGVGILFFFIYKNFSISRYWLPDKWSNFEFWSEKIERERENFSIYLMLPKTVSQAERLVLAVKSVFWGIVAFILYICEAKKRCFK